MKSTNYFNPVFIQKIMQEHSPEKDIQVQSVQPLAVDNSASILVALTAGQTEKPIGHFGLAVTYTADGTTYNRHLIMKVKPHGREISEMLWGLAAACNFQVGEVYQHYKNQTGFEHTHLRETEVYQKLPASLMPEIFGIYTNPDDDVFIVLMEYLEEVQLLNAVMAPEKWTDAHVRQALSQLAEWHACHLNQTLPAAPAAWTDAPSREYMQELSPLWQALLNNAQERFPDLYTPERAALLQEAIYQLPDYWQELELMPKTLVHNDLNPRNSCFKTINGRLHFCVYDWELATYRVPQYDVVEFLSFVLDADRYAQRASYLEFYRQALHARTGLYSDVEAFRRGFTLAAFDFGLHRLGMYMMAHAVSPYPFLPRVVNSYFDTLQTMGIMTTTVSDTSYI